MNIDLESLSKEELEKLKADVDKALKTIDVRRKAEAKKAAESIAKEFGYTLGDLLEEGKGGSKGAPKYRNPANLEQTWTGRGRKPGWVIEALAAGKSMDEMEI
ncbi:H-NS histone family protein [Pseudoprimorskyibacter insulae]|uniref:Trans-acting regulatory protein HvrA n=1 Tax=Pseudoprimorskyibacter insulae TaxID=1695997 RepID=A0A2R8APP2_9RHOB|nr:H-NS histone family protein [Pseudoprimorskyibacter insulae]SPF77839.1 Trans-acting regulatory protein HvrA [Pseudoprimorskyibacter insulae]